jgi:hypothetical protein
MEKVIGLAPDIIVRYFIDSGSDIERILRLGYVGKANIVVPQVVLMDALNCIKPTELSLDRLIELLKSVKIGGDDFVIRSRFFVRDKERVKRLRDIARRDLSKSVKGVEIKIRKGYICNSQSSR